MVTIAISIVKKNWRTISTDAVGDPVGRFEVRGFRCSDDDVLHITPSEILIGLEGQGADSSREGRGGGSSRVTARAVMMQIGSYNLFLTGRAWTVGRREGRRTRFAVPRNEAIFRRAAYRQCPYAVRVTVAVAVVVIAATVSGGPDEDRTFALATLNNE